MFKRVLSVKAGESPTCMPYGSIMGQLIIGGAIIFSLSTPISAINKNNLHD
jgi:hypothetical protein